MQSQTVYLPYHHNILYFDILSMWWPFLFFTKLYYTVEQHIYCVQTLPGLPYLSIPPDHLYYTCSQKTKKFPPSLKPITIARLFQRKNGHRETIGTGAKMATSQTPPFRQGVKVTRFCFYNLTQHGWASCSFLGGKMEKCFSCRRRRTMDNGHHASMHWN